MGDRIVAWLRHIKLDRYADAFLQNGFDDPVNLEFLDEGKWFVSAIPYLRFVLPQRCSRCYRQLCHAYALHT